MDWSQSVERFSSAPASPDEPAVLVARPGRDMPSSQQQQADNKPELVGAAKVNPSKPEQPEPKVAKLMPDLATDEEEEEGETEEAGWTPTNFNALKSNQGSATNDNNASNQMQTTGANQAERRLRPQKYCAVCGDKAIACNFNAVTCESCKAFFRRNAFKEQRLKCLFENRCVIDRVTRRFCSKCRLLKCFQIGMKREWILTEEQKQVKRVKIMQNKQIRQHQRPTAGSLQNNLSPVALQCNSSNTSCDRFGPYQTSESGIATSQQQQAMSRVDDGQQVKSVEQFEVLRRHSGARSGPVAAAAAVEPSDYEQTLARQAASDQSADIQQQQTLKPGLKIKLKRAATPTKHLLTAPLCKQEQDDELEAASKTVTTSSQDASTSCPDEFELLGTALNHQQRRLPMMPYCSFAGQCHFCSLQLSDQMQQAAAAAVVAAADSNGHSQATGQFPVNYHRPASTAASGQPVGLSHQQAHFQNNQQQLQPQPQQQPQQQQHHHQQAQLHQHHHVHHSHQQHLISGHQHHHHHHQHQQQQQHHQLQQHQIQQMSAMRPNQNLQQHHRNPISSSPCSSSSQLETAAGASGYTSDLSPDQVDQLAAIHQSSCLVDRQLPGHQASYVGGQHYSRQQLARQGSSTDLSPASGPVDELQYPLRPQGYSTSQQLLSRPATFQRQQQAMDKLSPQFHELTTLQGTISIGDGCLADADVNSAAEHRHGFKALGSLQETYSETAAAYYASAYNQPGAASSAIASNNNTNPFIRALEASQLYSPGESASASAHFSTTETATAVALATAVKLRDSAVSPHVQMDIQQSTLSQPQKSKADNKSIVGEVSTSSQPIDASKQPVASPLTDTTTAKTAEAANLELKSPSEALASQAKNCDINSNKTTSDLLKSSDYITWNGAMYMKPADTEIELRRRLEELDFDESERALINELCQATKFMFEQQDYGSKGQNSLNDVVYICDVALRGLIKTVKQIKAFKMLSMDDQIVLLKTACFKILLLRSTFHYRDDCEGWIGVKTGKVMPLDILKRAKKSLVYERHRNLVKKIPGPLRKDRFIMAILSLAILFDSNIKLRHSYSVSLDNLTYLSFLRKYVIATQPDPLTKYEALVETIEAVNACNEEYNVFFSKDLQPEQITPLLLEIFDISLNNSI